MLKDSDIRHFIDEGYLVVRSVLCHENVAAVSREYDELLRERSAIWRDANRFSGGEDLTTLSFPDHLHRLAHLSGFPVELLAELDITLPHMPFTMMKPDSGFHVGEGVLALLRNEKILDVVESFLGPEIMASPNQHCRMKLPVTGDAHAFGARRGETIYAPTMWHQDAMTQIPGSNDTQLITVWIPMSDVNERNGCLTVVPGAHKVAELLPWPMPKETIDRLESSCIPLPVSFGDIVLLHKRTPHGSRPNLGNTLRWSFDFRYYPAGQPTDRPWFPSIQVRSRAHPEFVQRDAVDWRRSWERARDMLVASGQPLPGRREFAQVVADAMIRRWEAGEYPTLAANGVTGASAMAAY